MEFNWSPGIGDPTVVGWLAVALYLLAALASYFVLIELGASAPEQQERFVWRVFLLLFLLLGINKQLDLQSALTETGRYIARQQGWYDHRQKFQFVLICVIAAAFVATLVGGIALLRTSSWPTRIALFGVGLVLTYVAMRAVSFHQVDAFFSTRLAGVRWAAVIEIGGLVVVLVAAGLRLFLSRPRLHMADKKRR